MGNDAPAAAKLISLPDAFTRITTMNNNRQLMLAWHLYSGDNEDRLVNNFGVANTGLEISGKTFQNWVNDVMDWSVNEMNTNTAYLRNGILGQYSRGIVGLSAATRFPAA